MVNKEDRKGTYPVGVEGQRNKKVRAITGRDKPEKIEPRSDFASVHAPRELREMLKSDWQGLHGSTFTPAIADYLVIAVVKQVKLWLKDHQHAAAMEYDKASQQAIEKIIKSLYS